MTGFTEDDLVCKLRELNSSQQSIQTLSLWLIYHRKHHAAVVNIWYKELLKTKDTKQLTLMYLANDVILNSKKTGPEYGKSFGEVLGDAFKHMAETGINAKTKKSLHEILFIWEGIAVYDAQTVQNYKEAVDANDVLPKKVNKRKAIDVEIKEPEKKQRIEKERNERGRSETRVEVDGQIEKPITFSPTTLPGDLPNPEKLIKALLDLDAVDFSNEAMRKRMASLPPEVPEVQLLSILGGRITPYTRLKCILPLIKCYIRNSIYIRLNQHLFD